MILQCCHKCEKNFGRHHKRIEKFTLLKRRKLKFMKNVKLNSETFLNIFFIFFFEKYPKIFLHHIFWAMIIMASMKIYSTFLHNDDSLSLISLSRIINIKVSWVLFLKEINKHVHIFPNKMTNKWMESGKEKVFFLVFILLLFSFTSLFSGLSICWVFKFYVCRIVWLFLWFLALTKKFNFWVSSWYSTKT